MIRQSPSYRRLLGVTTVLSMALPALPATALADDASAPPSRVGQMNSVSGSVSFNGPGTGGWAAATNNYPVTAGDSVYTQDNARAGIALDASQITLAPDTEYQVTALDSQNFTVTLSQGEVAYSIANLQPGQTYTISTPRGAVAITQNGQYDIQAGTASTPTLVNVYQGAATVTDPGVNLQVGTGQAGVLNGSDQITAQLSQAQQTSFFSSVASAQSNVAPPPAYAPAVCGQMPGASQLTHYGTWSQTPQYGAVWYPSVDPSWAPYRVGHWAYVQPWGWTWIESEPWGFAPFHYGRWIQQEGRWGWVPAAYTSGGYGPVYQPVYAPAVVSFFGLAAAGITAAAIASGSVGWVPLGPGEAYYPPYRVPPAYIRQINIINVHDMNSLHYGGNYYYGRDFPPGRFMNHGGATFVPAGIMSRGEHVSGYAHMPSPEMLAGARPIDPGFGHGDMQQAAFRLPDAHGPMAEMRPGAAPHLSGFAQHREMPGMPHGFSGNPMPHGMNGGMPPGMPDHAGFGQAPGFHAPPAPPSPGQHLGALPAAGNFHPNAPENHMNGPNGFHPQGGPGGAPHQGGGGQDFHPASQSFHQPEGNRPPAAPHGENHQQQSFHPPEGFHPQGGQPHPGGGEQFRPPSEPHFNHADMPRPEAQPHGGNFGGGGHPGGDFGGGGHGGGDHGGGDHGSDHGGDHHHP